MLAIAETVGEAGGTLIVDEVFRDGGEKSAIDLGDHVLTIGSLSKMYGLPGLRLGWITADSEKLVRLRTLQQYFTLTPGSFTVSLGAVALRNLDRFRRTELLGENRRILTAWAHGSAAVSISPPSGGTTVCLTVRSGASADTLFKRFRDEGLLLAPGGKCFEYRPDLNWFRLGYGTDSERLKRGLRLIDKVL